jgi:hypothetical protein
MADFLLEFECHHDSFYSEEVTEKVKLLSNLYEK